MSNITSTTADERFAKFVAEKCRSIDHVFAQFAEYWEEHIHMNGRCILQGAKHHALANRDSVVVLGAGPGRDVPIAELAREFNVVKLVDVDAEGMQRARDSLPPELQAKVELHVRDITSGFVQRLATEGIEIVDRAQLPQEAFSAILALYENVTPESSLDADDPLRSSYVVSCMIASQLFALGNLAVREAFQQKFHLVYPVARAEGALHHKVVKAHLNLLAQIANPGGLVFCSTDVLEAPVLTAMSSDERQKFVAGLAEFTTRSGWSRSLDPDIRAAFLECAHLSSPENEKGFSSAIRVLISGGRVPPEGTYETDLPPQIQDSLRGKELPAGQGIKLLERFRKIAHDVNARAVQSTFPGSLEEFCSSDFKTLGGARTWHWFSNPINLAALRIHALLLQPRAVRR